MIDVRIEDIAAAIRAIPELSPDRLVTYARLWQFETWLRQMVYVELRAKYANDWSQDLKAKAAKPRNNDQALTHMPSSEVLDSSFVTFGVLTATIADEWDLFKGFLPPETIWSARIEEVSQIRNRIAHFRVGHEDDYQRVIQLMRDVDKGFFRFCTSINQPFHGLAAELDPVIQEFAPLNPYIKHGDVTNARSGLYAHFSHGFEIRIDIVKRPWVTVPSDFNQVIGCPGFFYDLNVHEHDGREYNYDELLKSTKGLHDWVLYISLGSMGNHFRVLIPSLLGKDTLIQVIDAFINAAANHSWQGRARSSLPSEYPADEIRQIQGVADKWPEYVIGPENPIAFLTPDMECSFFGV